MTWYDHDSLYHLLEHRIMRIHCQPRRQNSVVVSVTCVSTYMAVEVFENLTNTMRNGQCKRKYR